MNFRKSILLLSLSFLGITTLKAQNVSLKLSNDLNEERQDELIVLKRDFLEKKFKKKLEGKIAVKNKNQPVFVQFDDLNGDGIWDEAAFLLNFGELERKELQLSVETTNSARIKPVYRAYVRQKRRLPDNTFGANLNRDSVPANQPNTDFKLQKLPSMLTEGPAWENDKVGFRLYMDIRNQKDIWGKRTAKMVLDEIGANPGNSYHKLSDWGMDILIVGKSLSAGGIAVNVPLQGRDTLVRLGGANMGRIVYEKVADGPIRAIFRMHYPEWNILGDGKLASATEEISIWGGQYFFESKVTLNGAPRKTQLVTGIVNLSAKQSHEIFNKQVAAVYSYDMQSENKDKLGMGVSMLKKYWTKFGNIGDEGVDIKNSYTAYEKLDKNNSAKFRFYVGWELTDNKFKSQEGFARYMKDQLAKQASPIKVK
ncbi:hypothetical protein Pedsa_3816 [Pseudopedobacter saltans DSM 12145]|uniref:DUF4861 domain-containing protein n=1 Tax=Pseudopedobacter saltans (strain ATCC 51119 / DSM 12145 / JCM 21818 / CCUG 39354 / LMG 10337 / NBRC 100064 / NCIMB 13643) TaxID=762903 RepID=F0S772_PSESL|nr:DUF4861 domain-containing protein [Pseudopedobacter saltans]ADY54345.1 hypothetical protein Pedsa_3816 [Pseudopedobacter saltans DSM 12145]